MRNAANAAKRADSNGLIGATGKFSLSFEFDFFSFAAIL